MSGRTLASVDLRACDREPIHVPERTQPHGFLAAYSDAGMLVAHSANLPETLDSDALASPSQLTAWLAQEPHASRWWEHHHRTADGLQIVEVEERAKESEPAAPTDRRPSRYPWHRRLAALPLEAELDVLSHAVAEQIRVLTGFDRVMVYRFFPDFHGEVIGEAKDDRLPPFMGLHYPASDIPAQARALYMRNRSRHVPDVGYAPVDLLWLERRPAHRPLDMSDCELRSVSPVHIEYLQNMGVASTLSLSLVANGTLWGLIACHHQTPRHIGPALRQECELLTDFVNQRLDVYEHRAATEPLLRARRLHVQLVDRMSSETRLGEALLGPTPNLLGLIDAEGAAVIDGKRVQRRGDTPTENQLRLLSDWLDRVHPEAPLVAVTGAPSEADTTSPNTTSPNTTIPAATDPAATDPMPVPAEFPGVLVARVGGARPREVYWFRREFPQTVRWAGNPDKVASTTAGSPRLSPRRSFETWTLQVRGQSRPWEPWEQRAALELRQSIAETDLRLAAQLERRTRQLAQRNEDLETFAAAISHDLRTPVSHASRLAQEALREYESGADSLEETLRGIDALGQRMDRTLEALVAYARADFGNVQRQTISSAEIIEEAVAALRASIHDAEASVTIEGGLPVLECEPRALDAIVMNLVSNALKYTDRDHPSIRIGPVPGRPGWLQVADDGIGMDFEKSKRVFGLFRRLHPSGHYGGGSGVGLALVKRLVDRHEGQIDVWSQPGAGTTIAWCMDPGAADSK